MYNVIFSLAVDCPFSERGGYELRRELIVPIPPYIGMEIYHSGTELTITYLSIEYDQTDVPQIICSLDMLENVSIQLVKHMYDNGWHLNPDFYRADEIKQIEWELV